MEFSPAFIWVPYMDILWHFYLSNPEVEVYLHNLLNLYKLTIRSGALKSKSRVALGS